ncbi:MAG: hypothetical protein M0P71_01105 [Melioribacteraceae bacterium]|nr:hypothetical protein [Melioribacteraceae bacterium]
MKIIFEKIETRVVDVSENKTIDSIKNHKTLGWRAIEVGGKMVISHCEGCECPILEDSHYTTDIEGCYLCDQCFAEMVKEESTHKEKE